MEDRVTLRDLEAAEELAFLNSVRAGDERCWWTSRRPASVRRASRRAAWWRRRGDMRTAGTEAGPRRRARHARNTGNRPCASAEVRKDRSASLSHSGGASPNASVRSEGALTRRGEQPTNARGEGPTGLTGIPRTPTSPSVEGPVVFVSVVVRPRRLMRLRSGSFACRAGRRSARARAASNTSICYRSTARSRTPARRTHARSVGLVRSRKVPDGRPPEPVVRHARFTSFPVGPDAGSRPLSTLFERPR